MKPDSQINEYKRMYRHNQDDSSADYELLMEKLKERLYYFKFCAF